MIAITWFDIGGIGLGWLVIAISFAVAWKLLKDTDYPDP